jgi:hypothetical protein
MRKTTYVGIYVLLYMMILLVSSVSVYSLNCSTLNTSISIDIDSEPYVNPTTQFLAVLPEQYRSQSMKCLVYVKSVNNTIIQINPEKTEYSQVWIPLFSKPEETREFFSAQDGVVNAYITYRDLVAYTQFVLEVECISENTGDKVIGQKCITPLFKGLENVGTRAVWGVQNADMLVIISVVVIIVIIVLGTMYRKIFK